MTEPSSALRTAEQLRTALEGLVEALRRPDVEALLGSEAAVEAAIRSLSPDLGDGGEVSAIRRTVAEARLALLRCRRLGASLAGEVRRSLGQSDTVYGAGLQPIPTGRVLNARG